MFLEEPVWRPEDLRRSPKCEPKAGSISRPARMPAPCINCRQMMKAGAVSHAQPSVTKVGGITEFLKVAALADELGVRLAPHSPYFGPGLLATLQLLALRDDASFVEMFYMKRAACLWRGRVDVDANGNVGVPQGPGLGYEPDKAVMEQYRVSDRDCCYFAPSFAGAASFAAGAAAFFASSAALFCAVCNSATIFCSPRPRSSAPRSAGWRRRLSADGPR